ncbi:A disintegrin and metalloproteinase with thrombospondin motifs 6-like [Oculina patagonica]
MKTAILVWVCFVIVLFLRAGSTHGLPSKPLHHHMTRREIIKYFGVSEHAQVPKYDVVNPYQSNEAGECVSFALHQSRNRRSTDDSDITYYKLRAFGSDLHIKLKRNNELMNHLVTVETQNEDGTMTSHSVPKNTFYLGHVSSDPGSVVALSNLRGLTGMIQTSRGTLFIQPLPAHLAKHVTNNGKMTSHLLFKSSAVKASQRRHRRSLDSGVEKYLKAALVVPASMEKKYGKEKTVQRLLVMANIVAGLFQDESIGATKIKYSVSKIYVVRPDKLNIGLTDSNQVKLVKMIRWAAGQKRNQRDFDAFTFISDGPDTGGKSSAFTMCRGESGSAVTDVGLETAWFIAHEIGHNMGLPHDGGRADCPNNKYIMASKKPTGPSSYLWSPCSREKIQEFLNTGNRSWCLNDAPSTAHAPTLPPEDRDKLPGEIIDGDQQCRDAIGENFKHSTRESLRQDCATLWCEDGSGIVLSAESRVADGTECGVSKWCINGSCVSHEKWSPCSRSCGGGVQYKNKPCDPTTRLQGSCSGTTREWRICSRQPCPRKSRVSHRDLQCRQRKAGNKGMIFQSDPCRLYCGSGRKWRKSNHVDDGTRCSRYGLNVCIQGRCQPVGCDHELGSGARFDRCRVCNGNGTTCARVTGNFTEQWDKLGPANARLIVEIPTGTLNARFKEMEATTNRIGLQNAAGRYLSTGKGRTSRKGKTFYVAGSKISRYQPRSSSADALFIVGPTTAPLRVVLIRTGRQSTKGVRYQYFRPLFANETADNASASFEWKFADWSACSASCSSGFQTRDVWCVRSDDETPASFSACAAQKMLAKKRSCNTKPCAPE